MKNQKNARRPCGRIWIRARDVDPAVPRFHEANCGPAASINRCSCVVPTSTPPVRSQTHLLLLLPACAEGTQIAGRSILRADAPLTAPARSQLYVRHGIAMLEHWWEKAESGRPVRDVPCEAYAHAGLTATRLTFIRECDTASPLRVDSSRRSSTPSASTGALPASYWRLSRGSRLV